MLHESLCEAQAAVGLDLKRSDASPVIVGHEHEAPGFIERDKARSRAMSRNLIQKFQLPRLAIDLERTDRSGLLPVEIADFINRIQMLPVGMHRDERRICRLGSKSNLGELPGSRVEVVRVDAFALLLRRVRPDVR